MSQLKRPKILIVEDEVDLYDLYRMALEDNMECVFVADINSLKAHIASADAVILDYEIRGHKFEDLLKATQGKPVMVVTGHLDRLFYKQVSKPFLQDELLDSALKMIQVNNKTSDNLSLDQHDFKAGEKVTVITEPKLGIGEIVAKLGEDYYSVKFDRDGMDRPIPVATLQLKRAQEAT